jgi:magnesium transporter
MASDAQTPCPPASERVRVTRFDPVAFEVRQASVAGLEGVELQGPGTLWLDFADDPSLEELSALGVQLTGRPLEAHQPPRLRGTVRIESYDDLILVVLPHTVLNPGARPPALAVGRHWVLSVGWPRESCVEVVHQRLARGEYLRARGAAYLACAILQQAVASLLPEVEALGDALADIEGAPPSPDIFERLHATRRSISELRHAVVPLRDAASGLSRELQGPETEHARQALRDLYETAEAPLGDLDDLHATTATIIDIGLSTVTFRTNEVIRVLTIISTTFLPMSFITSWLGMNVMMPISQREHGYKVALVLVVLAATAMLGFFWHKGWLTSDTATPHPPRRARGETLH